MFVAISVRKIIRIYRIIFKRTRKRTTDANRSPSYRCVGKHLSMQTSSVCAVRLSSTDFRLLSCFIAEVDFIHQFAYSLQLQSNTIRVGRATLVSFRSDLFHFGRKNKHAPIDAPSMSSTYLLTVFSAPFRVVH